MLPPAGALRRGAQRGLDALSWVVSQCYLGLLQGLLTFGQSARARCTRVSGIGRASSRSPTPSRPGCHSLKLELAVLARLIAIDLLQPTGCASAKEGLAQIERWPSAPYWSYASGHRGPDPLTTNPTIRKSHDRLSAKISTYSGANASRPQYRVTIGLS
jgi:hypothetical protein